MLLTYQHRSQIGQLIEVRLKIGRSIIWESYSTGQAIFQIRLKQVLASPVFHRLRDSRLKGFKAQGGGHHCWLDRGNGQQYCPKIFQYERMDPRN